MAPIRVLIVDDSAVVRRQVALMLEGDPTLEVVGTASNGRLALEKLSQHAADVVVLDLEMPEMDGLEVLRQLRRQASRLPVLLFSALTERAGALTLDALALGAKDYVTKPSALAGGPSLESARAELVTKIKVLHGGWVPGGVSGNQERLLGTLALATRGGVPLGECLPRGIPVLALMADATPDPIFAGPLLCLRDAELPRLIHLPRRIRSLAA